MGHCRSSQGAVSDEVGVYGILSGKRGEEVETATFDYLFNIIKVTFLLLQYDKNYFNSL